MNSKEKKEWFTAFELEGVESLPNKATNITRKATKEDWKRRQVKGKKGVAFEYHYSSFPPEVQKALGLYEPMTLKEAREMNHPELGKAYEALDLGRAVREIEAILNRFQSKIPKAVFSDDFPLSRAEQRLIENYRKASPDGKEVIENVAETMAEMQERKKESDTQEEAYALDVA